MSEEKEKPETEEPETKPETEEKPEKKKEKPIEIKPAKKPQPKTEETPQVEIHEITECLKCGGDLGYDKKRKIYICLTCGTTYQKV